MILLPVRAAHVSDGSRAALGAARKSSPWACLTFMMTDRSRLRPSHGPTWS